MSLTGITPLCGYCGKPVIVGTMYNGAYYHMECTRGPGYSDHDEIIRLRSALSAAEARASTAREKALEEAAEIVRKFGEIISINAGEPFVKSSTDRIAAAIRSLKEKKL